MKEYLKGRHFLADKGKIQWAEGNRKRNANKDNDAFTYLHRVEKLLITVNSGIFFFYHYLT